jgi:S-methylmethionine-dependent homocysteine/selenocysteine methylase
MSEVRILDGGMGTELQARGVPMDADAWSALANLDAWDQVRAAHEDFIRAGADVVIANTYVASRWPLERAGRGDRVTEANRRAVEAAQAARAVAADGRHVEIAGSMSSTAARVIGTGATVGPQGEELLAHYREQASALVEAGVDLIALEMISAPTYGVHAVEAAIETGLPVWLGVSPAAPVEGGRLPPNARPPYDLEEVLVTLLRPGITAVTVMHTELSLVLPGLEVVRRVWDGPVGAYPHHGSFTAPYWVFSDLTPSAFADEAERWVAAGAELVGGCCGIRPDHIRAVRDRLAG